MWYYIEMGRQIGPIREEEFELLVRAGRITSTTPVWKDGMSDWQEYGKLRGIEIFGVAGTDWEVCAECRNQFLRQEMIRFQESWICHSCKPLFFQRIKEGAPVPGRMVYAGFWVRFFAKLMDGIVIWIVEVGLLLVFGVILGSGFERWSQGPPTAIFILIYPLIFGISIGYSVFFLGKFGATPGKMALGLRVVTSQGEPINYTKAFVRFFAEILSALVCYVGYIMAAFDEQKKALHDQICDTRVIRK